VQEINKFKRRTGIKNRISRIASNVEYDSEVLSSMEDSDVLGETILEFSIPTSNRFEERERKLTGGVCRTQTRKRKKGSKGSVEMDSFDLLNTDEKLTCMFDQMNKAIEKIDNVERKIDVVNKGYVTTNERVNKVDKCVIYKH
jgi:hypothetical protein